MCLWSKIQYVFGVFFLLFCFFLIQHVVCDNKSLKCEAHGVQDVSLDVLVTVSWMCDNGCLLRWKEK